MNGFRCVKSNFYEISTKLFRVSSRNVGIRSRKSLAVNRNSKQDLHNSRPSRELEDSNQISNKVLFSSISHSPLAGSLISNGNIPNLNKQISRYFCTAHDGFCLSFEEFRALIKSGDIQIIDVREPDEIEQEGAIPNAVNIPLGNLKKALKLDEDAYLQKYKVTKPEKYDANIVFVGLGPIKSSAARAIAFNQGYIYSRHYGGGYLEWSERMKSGTD